MKIKKIISISVLSAFLAVTATGCGSSGAMGAQVEVFELKKQVISDSVSTSGIVEGIRTDVSNSQATKAVKVNVKEGDFVEKGDVLFEFDATDIEEQYKKLTSLYEIEDDKIKHEQNINKDNLDSVKSEKTAILAQAQRKVSEAQTERDNAYNNFDDMNKRHDSLINEVNTLTDKINNAATDEEYAQLDEALTKAIEQSTALEAEINSVKNTLSAYDNALNDAKDAYSNTEREYNDRISAAENAIETEKFVINSVEQKEINDLKEQMEKCIVTAPVSGVIVAPQVTEGAVPMGETLVTIIDTSDLKVKASVSESEIFKLKEGLSAEIKTVATEDDIISGSLTGISKLATTAENGSNNGYAVEIDIDEKTAGDNLYLGMTARTDIILSKTGEVLALPYDSIVTDETDETKKYVLAAVPDGDKYITKKIYVETGFESSYYIEASADELKEGMYIVCYPEFYVEDIKIDVTVQ